MLRRRCDLSLVACLVLLGASPSAQAAEDSVSADKARLKAAGVPTDGPGLLAFFKKRTLGDKERARIKTLISQLGSDDFDEREKAEEALIEFGPGARRALEGAAKGNKELEVRKRAARCLKVIGKNSATDVLAAALRVLAHHRPAGTVGVLVNYAPSAADAEVVEEVGRVLARAGMREGKADEALLGALKDKRLAARGVAGAALAHGGGKKYRPDVYKLLKDKSVSVRRRVALALLEARDKQSVPVLIALLTEAGGETRELIEERLGQVAGEKGPAPGNGAAEGWRERRTAWEKWWKESGDRVNLAKVEFTPRVLGYTLITLRGSFRKGGPRTRGGRVQELDRDGKVRWEIDGLNHQPSFAKVLRHDRVLICEYPSGRVSERTFKGEIKWQASVPRAMGAQRLRNGHTFIYTRNQLVELDRSGKEVLKLTRPYDVVAAQVERNGNICMLSSSGRVIRLNRSGKELKSFETGRVRRTVSCSLHVLRNGHVLVPHYYDSKVAEYDRAGKQVWSASVARPTCARRLPNGDTLVCSVLRHIVVLDKSGKQKWRKTITGIAYYADRR
jgi:hypothetical protein